MSRAVALILVATLSPFVAAQDTVAPNIAIDKDRVIYQQILDDVEFQAEDKNPGEYQAYNAVLLHARQFAVADLEKAARRDVTFKDLLLPVRKDFRLDLIRMEGRLLQLRKVEPTKELVANGVNELYEGWLYPNGERDPVCILMTELPAGVGAQADLRHDEMEKWVSFAGYSFKLFRYESKKADAKNPGKNVIRRAPVLMGRTFVVLPDPTALGQTGWNSTFVPLVLALFGGVALIIVGLNWYFRRTDRAALKSIDQRRDTNPFTE